MPSHVLSPDTQAVLLLCGSLGRRGSAPAGPLTTLEYAKLAHWLHQRAMRPGDLLSNLPPADFHDSPIGPERLSALLDRGTALALEVERWTNRGLWVLSRGDDAYPRLLRSRLGRYAPPLLHGSGDPGLLNSGGLAIVGSRDADADAERFARAAAARCAEQGITVVSGGARGVDSVAMMSALEAGGPVVGILADGLDRAATSGRYRDGLRAGTLVLASPYDPGARFSVGAAMGRNKIVYTLSHWGLVVSSSAGTGGTWAGAKETLQIGWVPVFVRDGVGVPEGNRALRREGAVPLTLEDVESTPDLPDLLNQLASGPREAKPQPEAAVPDLFTTVAVVEPMEEAASGAKADLSEVPASIKEASPVAASDLFEVVWPHIEGVLATPRSDHEVAAALNLQQGQAKAWLNHAVELGRVQRRGRPARYGLESSGGKQLQLLDTGPGGSGKPRARGSRRGKQRNQLRREASGD
jgi:predicted Rossmann fold nucleotide-binding protein DprA/Smf involved in DNA uptake